jgi:hypothetical protein
MEVRDEISELAKASAHPSALRVNMRGYRIKPTNKTTHHQQST